MSWLDRIVVSAWAHVSAGVIALAWVCGALGLLLSGGFDELGVMLGLLVQSTGTAALVSFLATGIAFLSVLAVPISDVGGKSRGWVDGMLGYASSVPGFSVGVVGAFLLSSPSWAGLVLVLTLAHLPRWTYSMHIAHRRMLTDEHHRAVLALGGTTEAIMFELSVPMLLRALPGFFFRGMGVVLGAAGVVIVMTEWRGQFLAIELLLGELGVGAISLLVTIFMCSSIAAWLDGDEQGVVP